MRALSSLLRVRLGAVKVFVDETIDDGASWPNHLAMSLSRSRIMVAVLSRDYFQSDWCRLELALMHHREKVGKLRTSGNPWGLIIPVVIDDGNCFPAEVQAMQGEPLHAFANPFMRPDSPKQEAMADVLRNKLCASIERALAATPPFDPAWEQIAHKQIRGRISNSHAGPEDGSVTRSTDPMSRIITFYSYKGGVGRTFALANIAVLLARRGKRVLLMDWDLEAPGLHRYFKPFVEHVSAGPEGLIHLLGKAENDSAVSWESYVTKVAIDDCEPIHLIASGDQASDYVERVRSFSWNTFFEDHAGGDLLNRWRNEWKASYDFVLVDSRTGITDTGGVCTIYLPDILVLVFSANEQVFSVVCRLRQESKRQGGSWMFHGLL